MQRNITRSSLLCLALAVPLQSFGGVAESLAAGQAASSIIDQLMSEAKKVIQQLESTIGMNQFQIRQSMLTVTDELAYKLKEIEGKTAEDANKLLRDFFLKTEASINEAAQATKAPLDQVQNIANTVNESVARIPTTDKNPRIRTVSPFYILAAAPSSDVTVKITGSELNHGAASLKVGEVACEKGEHTDNSISFLCKGLTPAADKKAGMLVGNLDVSLYRGFWDKLGGIFKEKEKFKKYSVALNFIPPSLGDYSVKATHQVKALENAERSGVVDAGNQHCQGERRHGPFTFTVIGGPEWSIVPGSIRVGKEIEGNKARSLDGPLEVTNKGFLFYSNLKNSGDCVKVLGKIVSYDARAWLKQNIHWTEQREVTTTPVANVSAGEMKWGVDIPITLPPNTIGFEVMVKQIDGAAPVVIGEDNSQRWFRVSANVPGNTLLIRPRPLDEALR